MTDGDLARALNAIAVTLNDQRAAEFDADRVQRIVTGALGGEPRLEAHRATPDSGFLRDEDGSQAAELRLEDGKWRTRLLREPRSSGPYVPAR